METQSEAQILKRNDPQYVFSFVTRELNLINDGNKETKKESVLALYDFIVIAQPALKPELIQELLITNNAKLIKFSFFDSIDKVREFSLKTLIYMYSYCTNIVKFFPFIFSTLVDKLDCNDLEGYGNLPEDFRPTPSQNPHVIIKTTESIEEIRNLYVKLMETLTINENALIDDYRLFVQDIVNITRTLCMDPCVMVAVSACEYVGCLATHFGKDLLYYFNSILSRGLLYALSHKQAKMRLAALNAIDKLMYCSPFKKNVEIMEQLMGFRDPNVVPIKDFYEPSTKFNYYAYLSSDSNMVVLKRFYEVISSWMMDTEDKSENEPRLIPYILSGLFDKNEEIDVFVYDRFNMIGQLYEKENEKELRDTKQFGIEAPWCRWSLPPDTITYPFPLGKRPSLGCRKIVNKYIRRYIKNLTSEFEGVDENIKLKVANLVMFSIIYTEEGIVEYLAAILLCYEREYIKVSNNAIDVLAINARESSRDIFNVMIKTMKLLGRFCDYESLTKLLYQTVKGDLNGNYPDIQRGALIALKYVFIGHIESSIDGLGMFKGHLKELFGVLGDDEKISDFLDSRASFDLISFYTDIIEAIAKIGDRLSKENIEEFILCNEVIFMNIVHALGANEFITSMKVFKYIDISLNSINTNIEKITKGTIKSFFSSRTFDTLKTIDTYLTSNFVSMQNKYYKILYLFMKSKLFFVDIENEEMIKLLLNVFVKIFNSDENFSVHSNALSTLLSFLQEEKISYKQSDKKSFVENGELFFDCIDDCVNVLSSAIKPYTKIDGEEFKFKFIDLLKDKSELEKKKQKSPKTLKTELRKNVLIFIKNILNKSEMMNISKNIDDKGKQKIFDSFLSIFNDADTLKYFYEEAESNRVMFSSIYYQFLVKYFVIYKKDIERLKKIAVNFEKYFDEEVYDQSVDIRQMSFTLLNLIISIIPKSAFYEPMKMLFSLKDGDDPKQYNFEALKAMSYKEQDEKNVEAYFGNFKLIMTSIVNAYLNEKMAFGSLCDNSMKLIIERFPVYIFNELIKAQKKGQIARIEFFNTMLTKHLK